MSEHTPFRFAPDDPPAPLPFPKNTNGKPSPRVVRTEPPVESTLNESADEILEEFESVSRRIEDLARELNCLGYFDDHGDDRPRAA